jgi:hypothetical protein
MNMKATFASILLAVFLLAFSFQKAFACHGTSLIISSVVVSGTDITINADSDPATCGCGPYFMEVEVVPASAAFSGNAPVWTSGTWGTAPWFHSILNVPGYSAPNWTDNCVLEPYTALVIPFAGLCPGIQYKWRIREIAAGSASFGPWSAPYTFTTPGVPVSPTLNPTATPSLVCLNNSTWLDAFGGGCSGPGTFSWAPSGSVSSPTSSATLATPTVTTTYTVTFFDSLLSTTFIDSVTVTVSPAIVATGSSIEAGCMANNGTAFANVTGGTPPYTYYWSLTGDTTSYLAFVGNSSYDVTITDANGCTQWLQVVVGDSCNPVWPGDVNDDSLADNFDILDLALAYGANGTARANASIVWNGWPSADWGQLSSAGIDYKFADCNGDSTVNMDDTTAILLNYGLYHTYRFGQPVYNTALPDLQIRFTQDSVASGGNMGVAQIVFGSPAQQAANVYGLAFTVSFNPQEIDVQNTGFAAGNSWLGTPGTDLFGVAHKDTTGQFGIAIARIDHTNRSGDGVIASIYFTTTSNLTGTGNAVDVPFTISNVKVISANDSLLSINTVNDTVTIFDNMLTSISAFGAAENLQVFPNPSEGIFNVNFTSGTVADYTIEILNPIGQVVYSEQVKQVSGMIRKKIDLSNQPAGLFLVKISGENGAISQKILAR